MQGARRDREEAEEAMSDWCKRGECLARLGWREAYDALACDGSKWTLSGRHLLLDGYTYYYLTDSSLTKLRCALKKPRG